jgi:hypothetical protein
MRGIQSQHKLSYWQRVFLQSKINGASYNGEALPGQVWCWPKNTYLQRRLHDQQDLGERLPAATQKVLIQTGHGQRH